MTTASKLSLYSYGVVAVNKPRSTMSIEVTPMEAVPMTNGELTDNLTSENVKGKDADGSSFETTVKSAVTVTARWLPFSSNRKTAPDVRRGEKVAIWKFADADKYYWSELEYEAKLRKLETVIYAFSNTQDESVDSAFDTTYFIEISTHDKKIHLHTSTSDGEPFGYDILLNTKEGTFQLRDTIENILFLDSGAKRFVMKNAAESFIDLNAEDLFINVVRHCTMKVGGNMTTTVGGNYELNVTGNYKTTTPKADFVTPVLSTSQVMRVGASLTTGTNGAGTGNCTIGGNVRMEGNLWLQGSIFGEGDAIFSGSVHAPNLTHHN